MAATLPSPASSAASAKSTKEKPKLQLPEMKSTAAVATASKPSSQVEPFKGPILPAAVEKRSDKLPSTVLPAMSDNAPTVRRSVRVKVKAKLPAGIKVVAIDEGGRSTHQENSTSKSSTLDSAGSSKMASIEKTEKSGGSVLSVASKVEKSAADQPKTTKMTEKGKE